MSKNQNDTVSIPVETVENLIKFCKHISSSIEFWFPGSVKQWPLNFIHDCIEDLSEQIERLKK